MKKIIYLFISSLMIVLFSCSNDSKDLTEDIVDSSNKLQVTYKGINYSASYDLINDSIVFRDGEEFTLIFKENLSQNPNLAAYYNQDGSIEYFDSYDELALIKNVISENDDTDIGTKSAYPQSFQAVVTFWDDTNYKDRSFTFYVENIYQPAFAEHLKYPFGFNDKCSAFKLDYLSNSSEYKAVLQMYEHDTFGGKCLVYEVSSSSRNCHVPRLKSVSFNDKMTSFRLSLVRR